MAVSSIRFPIDAPVAKMKDMMARGTNRLETSESLSVMLNDFLMFNTVCDKYLIPVDTFFDELPNVLLPLNPRHFDVRSADTRVVKGQTRNSRSILRVHVCFDNSYVLLDREYCTGDIYILDKKGTRPL
jgi:hypothetical protein